jgi:hypothetical protein
MNLLHKTEELSRFENEIFLEFFAIIIEYSKNSSFSNRDNSSVLWSKHMFESIIIKSKHSLIHSCDFILVSL